MYADLGLLVVRLVVGLLFIGHGMQKLAGWFGGHGLAGTGSWMEAIGLRPGRTWAAIAGTCEAVGGLLFALGLFTPLGSVLIAAVMFMAIARVHWDKGLWIADNGMEYALTHAAVVVGLALVGPGAHSLDALYRTALPVGPVLAFGLALALLVVFGSFATLPRQRVVEPAQRS